MFPKKIEEDSEARRDGKAGSAGEDDLDSERGVFLNGT
jgi:hypothetical protein